MTAQVKELQKEIRSINEANGWYEDERPFSADIALLHSEVDELEEALVLGGEYDNSTEEMADILIRLLDTAERRNYDIELAVQEEIVLDEPTIEADSLPMNFPLLSIVSFLGLMKVTASMTTGRQNFMCHLHM